MALRPLLDRRQEPQAAAAQERPHRHLEALCAEMGALAPFGVLLYGGSQKLLLSPRVVALPLGSVL